MLPSVHQTIHHQRSRYVRRLPCPMHCAKFTQVAQPADVTEVGSLKRKARDDDIDNVSKFGSAGTRLCAHVSPAQSTREERMSVTLVRRYWPLDGVHSNSFSPLRGRAAHPGSVCALYPHRMCNSMRLSPLLSHRRRARILVRPRHSKLRTPILR